MSLSAVGDLQQAEYLELICMVEIIVAVITIIGVIISNYFSNNSTRKLILYRIDQLEHKVNKHNNLIDRVYQLENRENIIETKIERLEK
jgi:hypothetical protein